MNQTVNETLQSQPPQQLQQFPAPPETKKLKLTKERARKSASETEFWPDIAIHG
jgi:hypothetical protein